MSKILIIGLLIGTFLLSGCGSAVATTATVDNEKLNNNSYTVPRFGQCYFIPEREDIGTWYLVDPNGTEFTIEWMKHILPESTGLEPDENGGIQIYNIDKHLDGWSVICKFPDGKVTEKGLIKIDYSLPQEDITMPPLKSSATPTPPTEILKLNMDFISVPVNGQCFLYTDREDKNLWLFVDKKNKEHTVEQMRKICPPAFGARPDSEGGLWLYNIGKYLDGWKVKCIYPDGAASEMATIVIDYTLPEEDPIMHPM